LDDLGDNTPKPPKPVADAIAMIVAVLGALGTAIGGAVFSDPEPKKDPQASPAPTAGASTPSPTPTTDTRDRNGKPNWVVRAGVATRPQQLIDGTRQHMGMRGLFGFSVQYYPGLTVDELARYGRFPHPTISYTTDSE
jgi:hypothetical protein